jgi:hypothetical protein
MSDINMSDFDTHTKIHLCATLPCWSCLSCFRCILYCISFSKTISAKVSSEKTPKKSFVGICYKYNGDGCEIANSCPFLHLCKNYIESKCESGKECKKSHNILEPQVKVIMEKHGIDVKRKPKEIFPDLLASVNEGKRQRERDNSKGKDQLNVNLIFSQNIIF